MAYETELVVDFGSRLWNSFVRCSSKTLHKGPCPYAPLDEALWYSYSPQADS